MKRYRSKNNPTIKERRKTMVLNLKHKYGIDILKDLNILSTKHYWNLTEMGKKYNVSRERVRQWYRLIKGRPFRPIRSQKVAKRNTDLVCNHDPRYKIAEYPEESNIGKGAIAEKMFFDLCTGKNFKVEIPCNRTVDIKINDYWIDVKYCKKSKQYSESITKYFRYIGKGKQIKKADFWACYHPYRNSFFIIPVKKTHPDKNGGVNIFISEQQSLYPNAKNRYWKYENNWQQLIPNKELPNGKEYDKKQKYQLKGMYVK